jgi:hypothetical protein
MAGGEGLTMTLTAALLLSVLAGLLLACCGYCLLSLLLPEDDAEPVTDQGQARAAIRFVPQRELFISVGGKGYSYPAQACPYCGAHLADGHLYCPECYRQVKGDAA